MARKKKLTIGEEMTALYNKAIAEKMQLKDIIATAVQIGINHEQKIIKEGIDIVFTSLHK